ncbi:MAG: zinc-containing alcohol dehydrogenase [Deinococcus sp.]|nr:zinc-containing alcohol dehydrogenase [Deinococcus sp.]
MTDASFIRKYGRPGVLERGPLPAQALGPHDVRIQIHAASVNPLDWRVREGTLTVLRCTRGLGMTAWARLRWRP